MPFVIGNPGEMLVQFRPELAGYERRASFANTIPAEDGNSLRALFHRRQAWSFRSLYQWKRVAGLASFRFGAGAGNALGLPNMARTRRCSILC